MAKSSARRTSEMAAVVLLGGALAAIIWRYTPRPSQQQPPPLPPPLQQQQQQQQQQLGIPIAPAARGAARSRVRTKLTAKQPIISPFLPSAQVLLANAPRFHSWSGCTSSRYEPLQDALRKLGWSESATPDRNVSMYFQCTQCCQSGACCHKNHRGGVERKSAPFPALLNRVSSPSSRGACVSGCKDRQLQCRRDFAAESGCSYEALGLQPRTYRLPEDCAGFLSAVGREDGAAAAKGRGARHATLWLAKPPCSSQADSEPQVFVTARRAVEFGRGACAREWRGLMVEYIRRCGEVVRQWRVTDEWPVIGDGGEARGERR